MSSHSQETKTDSQKETQEQEELQKESQEETQELSQEPLKESIELCIFCNVKLNYGFDENEMLHCQLCHNIWDGNAQCNC